MICINETDNQRGPGFFLNTEYVYVTEKLTGEWYYIVLYYSNIVLYYITIVLNYINYIVL